MNIKIPSSEESLLRIKDYINKTPLFYSERLSKTSKSNVYLKLENLQITGSFKARGALNKVLKTKIDKNPVAASSGNHGAAVSYALSVKNKRGIIYVPNSAISSKVKKIKSYGSDVIKFGEDCLDAENEAIKFSKENNIEFISPYNDVDIISGQGTIAVEIMNQINDLDAVFVTVGGGGLISGIAYYLKSLNPNIEVVGCSPENSSIMINSIKSGKITNKKSLETLSDGSAGGVEEGSITFDLCKNYIDHFCLVKEGEISEQIRNAIYYEKFIIEGAAAVAIASFIKMKDLFINKNIAIIVCGGNIDSKTIKSVI